MCLYPKLIRNKKYYPTKKNNYNPPQIAEYDEKGNIIKYLVDPRTLYVPIGCGKCIECKKQKAREWQVRLCEEQKEWQYIYCKTLTFSNEELKKLCDETNLKESNAVATIAMRRFLERWRKKYKKSLRHWFITELGHENTERIHMHGIIFADKPITHEEIQNIWKYGNVDEGEWWGLKTINYLIKYVNKVDTDHKNFEQIVLCSKGIGNNYLKRYFTKQIHKYNGEKTIEFYRLPNGAKVNMPVYYRNKLWSEEIREKLWCHRLDKDERYIMGIKINNVTTIEGERKYYNLLKTAQETNKKLGFGDDSKQWKKKAYNITWRMLRKAKKNTP